MPTTDRTARGSTTISHRAVRVIAAWVLLAVLCTAGVSVATARVAAATEAVVAAPQGRYQPCEDGEGITVVVDYQGEGGRGVEAGCAAGSPASGMAALASAGFPVDPFGGSVVCRIDSLPSSGSCNMMPPARAFWSYWTSTDGTNWSFNNEGAARRPKPGTTEGWSFARTKPGEPTKQAPPPRPPTVQAPTTTPPTTPPPTSPPATAAPGSGGAGTGPGTGTGTGAGPSSGSGSGSQEGGSPGSGATPTKPGSAATPGGPDGQGGSSTKIGDEAASEKNGPAGSNDPATGDDTPPESGTTTATDSGGPDGSATVEDSLPGSEDGRGGDEVASGKAADGQVQNSARARQANDEEDRGSPVPAIFAAVTIVALLGIGVRASRRNRAES